MPFSATEFAGLLRETIFANPEAIHYFESIDSTNAAAVQAASEGAPEGSIFLAEEQRAGRGRGGHQWESPAGTGIYLSVVLRPKLPASEILWLSLIAGLAARAAIAEITTVSPDLRWPNDIMIGERKMGGILTEISTDTRENQIRYAVVGIGLNINQDSFPAELSELATSLRIETGKEWPKSEITTTLLKSVHREYQALQSGVLADAARSVIRRFEAGSSYARGARVHVDDHSYGEFEGVTQGLDQQGFLQVQTATGLVKVINGGVRKTSKAD